MDKDFIQINEDHSVEVTSYNTARLQNDANMLLFFTSIDTTMLETQPEVSVKAGEKGLNRAWYRSPDEFFREITERDSAKQFDNITWTIKKEPNTSEDLLSRVAKCRSG